MIHFLHFAKRNLRTRKLEAKLLRVLAADVGKLQRRVLLGFSSPELKIASSEECKIVIVRPRPVYRINRLLYGKEPRISVLQSKTRRSTLSRQLIPDSACVRLDVLLYDTLELGVILRDYFAM